MIQRGSPHHRDAQSQLHTTTTTTTAASNTITANNATSMTTTTIAFTIHNVQSPTVSKIFCLRCFGHPPFQGPLLVLLFKVLDNCFFRFVGPPRVVEYPRKRSPDAIDYVSYTYNSYMRNRNVSIGRTMGELYVAGTGSQCSWAGVSGQQAVGMVLESPRCEVSNSQPYRVGSASGCRGPFRGWVLPC